MAKKENSLAGFDPLAWMEEEGEQVNDSTDQDKKHSESNLEITIGKNENDLDTVASEKDKQADEVESSVGVLVESEVQQKVDSSNETTITLNATLNIQNVVHLHEQALKLLESQDKIEIDASSVSVIDTATLQLLVVLKKTAVELHKEVIIDFPSDNFIESAKLLGLSEILEVDQAAAGFF